MKEVKESKERDGRMRVEERWEIEIVRRIKEKEKVEERVKK